MVSSLRSSYRLCEIAIADARDAVIAGKTMEASWSRSSPTVGSPAHQCPMFVLEVGAGKVFLRKEEYLTYWLETWWVVDPERRAAPRRAGGVIPVPRAHFGRSRPCGPSRSFTLAAPARTTDEAAFHRKHPGLQSEEDARIERRRGRSRHRETEGAACGVAVGSLGFCRVRTFFYTSTC